MRTRRPRVAVVTGAASGIGRAVCERFEGEGWHVYRAGHSVRGPGSVELDVRSEEAWGRLVSLVRAEFGYCDALVNSAGILREAPLQETTLELWDDVISVNLTGVFLGCRAMLPLLELGETPAICNVSSIDGLRGSLNHSAYAASKGGITSLTRALAYELAPKGIRVNAVCPGTVDTPMVDGLIQRDAALGQPREAKHPLGRISTAEEQAAAIAFLCGEDSSFVTGVSLSVDGGRAIR